MSDDRRDLDVAARPSAGQRAGLCLALYQPDIPQNAGTLLRTCACFGVTAAIIEPAGFPTGDRDFRRAGLDYLEHVVIVRHASFSAFESWRASAGRRLVLLTTKGAVDYRDASYAADDILMVGRESAGVPDDVHRRADLRVVIPMRSPLRSLNVAIAGALVLGEAMRQGRAAGAAPAA